MINKWKLSDLNNSVTVFLIEKLGFKVRKVIWMKIDLKSGDLHGSKYIFRFLDPFSKT